MYIYIYTYMVTPHELPTLVLYGKYCVKPAFPAGSDSISLKNCQKQIQFSSSECARQLVQVRREHALNDNTVLFQSKTNRQETRLGST